jgi:hypothetical protein
MLEHSVEDLASLLWILTGQKFHGTLKVSEEDGHQLAFPY